MPDHINFVREQRRQLSKHQEMDRKIFRYVAIVSIVAGVIFVVSLVARITLAFNIKTITDKQNDQIAQIQAQEDNEKSYVIFAAKLQALSQLFTNRRNKQEAIKYFSTLFDNTVLINGIRYTADATDTNALTFSILTKNIFTLQNVINVLSSADVQNRFQSLRYSNLTRSSIGEYDTQVDVVLKPGT